MDIDDRAIRLDRRWVEMMSEKSGEDDVTDVLQTTKKQYAISDFVNWQKDRTLVLSPKFQRRPVWKEGAKSFLIDTILKGYPIPVIFLRELPTDLKTLKAKREVVDGQQRIRSLLEFIAPETLKTKGEAAPIGFAISESHGGTHAGKRFGQLPVHTRRRILDYQFSVHVFPSDTDEREILQIFARMNATGVTLNKQELRNAEFFGRFKTLAYKLGTQQFYRWQEWGIFSPYKIARMGEVQLTSELMILIMDGVSEGSAQIIDKAYATLDDKFPLRKIVEERFSTVFDTIDDAIPASVRRLFRKQSLFYALFAAVYAVQYGLKSTIKPAKSKALPKDMVERFRIVGLKIADDSAPKGVLDAKTRRTSHVKERRDLIDYLLKK